MCVDAIQKLKIYFSFWKFLILSFILVFILIALLTWEGMGGAASLLSGTLSFGQMSNTNFRMDTYNTNYILYFFTPNRLSAPSLRDRTVVHFHATDLSLAIILACCALWPQIKSWLQNLSFSGLPSCFQSEAHFRGFFRPPFFQVSALGGKIRVGGGVADPRTDCNPGLAC